jgi:hypothetical protein
MAIYGIGEVVLFYLVGSVMVGGILTLKELYDDKVLREWRKPTSQDKADRKEP